MNISASVLFSFFENSVHVMKRPVQTLRLWAPKYVQLQRRRVQVFGEKLNISKGDLYSFFLEKLNMLSLDVFRLGYPTVKKRDAE